MDREVAKEYLWASWAMRLNTKVGFLIEEFGSTFAEVLLWCREFYRFRIENKKSSGN